MSGCHCLRTTCICLLNDFENVSTQISKKIEMLDFINFIEEILKRLLSYIYQIGKWIFGNVAELFC